MFDFENNEYVSKILIWYLAGLTWGAGDLVTTYYAVNVFNQSETNNFLRETGLHKSFITFLLLKIASLAILIYVNDHVFSNLKKYPKHSTIMYYVIPFFFFFSGLLVTYNNFDIIINYL